MSDATSQNIVPNITFNQIPLPPYYLPSTLMEVRPNFGNVGLLPLPARNLIIAQMISTGSGAGTATPGTLQQNIFSWQQATALFGAGSMAEGVAIAYFNGPGPGIPLDMIGIADAAEAAKAVYTVTFGGTWTTNGTTAIQAGDTRFATGTLSTDTASSTATEWAAQVSADPQFSFVATVATDVVTLTAKNAGTEANNLNFVTSPAAGDALVPGMTVTCAQTTQGATNPSIAAAISAITGLWYTDICAPYQDTTNIGLLTAELARRFGAMVQEDARAYVCVCGTFSQQLSAIANINSPYVVPFGWYLGGSMPWQVAGALLGVASWGLLQDPSLELIGVALPGIVGPQRSNLPSQTEQELLLAGKVSTFTLTSTGTVQIQRLVSGYLTNSQGVVDGNTYFPVNEVAVATRIRYDWRTFLKLMYPQNKLAPDGSLAEQSNPNICTPRRAQGCWAMRMNVYATNGWIVNETADAAAAVFKIDANDPNRLDYQVQYTRIGNLVVSAGVLEFAAQ